MKDIKNLNKVSFFKNWWYNIVENSTSAIINIFILILLFANIYLQYKSMNYEFNMKDMWNLLITPWVAFSLILYWIYNLVLLKKIYFTIEGEKTFTELLDQYLFILSNRKKNTEDYKKWFILKNI